MKIITTVQELRDELRKYPRPLGLVPTMGFLHEGHISLVRGARLQNATVAATIFVNPMQFGPSEDLSTYPRDMEGDLRKLESAGTDLVFCPPTEEVYPKGFDTYVDVGRIADRLEGKSRPGHFKGVATVVCKLLALFRPDKAYFGQKDAQQCRVIKKLNADLNLGVDLVFMPTVREPDGLALSSRNVYLNPAERKAATVLYRSLMMARSLRTGGETDAEEIKRQMHSMIEGGESLAKVDYISIANNETLEELSRLEGPALASLAVRFGRTRLIDNMLLESRMEST